MLINARHADELRVAIIEDGILEAYEVEAAESGMRRGNIYRGVVAKVESSLNAAFIEYGAERHGFLPGDDIVPQAYQRKFQENGKRPQVADVLQRGMPVLVQVVKEAVGQKGAALTTNLSIAGRYLVLTPYDETRGVSRKVEDEAARKKLREQLGSFVMPDGCGVIARTNALDQLKSHLSRDLNALLRLWKRLETEAKKGKGARLLYSDQDLVLQALRDYLDSSIEEVYVDSDLVFQKSEDYMRAFMPRAKTQLIRYEERIPLFARFHLDQQIERIYDRSVSLPSGGSIVIDGTEALTAIDVNSGKSRGGSSHEDTVARTNIEAAQEVARQLRMRDIGGLLVVDFIDMRQRRNHRKVEKTLRDAMKADRARVSIGRISENGLLEINRQRIKQSLQLRTHRACPTCNGAGLIASPEFIALGLLRRIEARAAAGDLKAVRIALHPELADGVQNSRRQELAELEREFDIQIEIVAAAHLHRSDETVEWKRRQLGKNEPELAPRGGAAALTPSDLMKKPGRAEIRAEKRAERMAEQRSRGAAPASSSPSPEGREGEEPEEETRPEEGRKRRRRRRRKKRPGTGEAAASSPGGEGAGSRQEGNERPAADGQGEGRPRTREGSNETSARDGERGEQGRPRRRSRRRRRGEPRPPLEPQPQPEPERRTEAADSEAAEWHRRRTEAAWRSRVHSSFLDSPPTRPEPPPGEGTAEGASSTPKPQESSGSRQPSSAKAEDGASERAPGKVSRRAPEGAAKKEADSTSGEVPDKAPRKAPTKTPEGVEVDRPKPRRAPRRTARPKPAAESEGSEAAPSAGSESSSPPVSEVGTKEAAPVRKRAPRRRTATSEAKAEDGDGAAAPREVTAPSKPARRKRAPSKTAASKAAASKDSKEESAEAAPAPRSRARRAPSKKKSEGDATPAAASKESGSGASGAKAASAKQEPAPAPPPKESLRPKGWPPLPGTGGQK